MGKWRVRENTIKFVGSYRGGGRVMGKRIDNIKDNVGFCALEKEGSEKAVYPTSFCVVESTVREVIVRYFFTFEANVDEAIVIPRGRERNIVLIFVVRDKFWGELVFIDTVVGVVEVATNNFLPFFDGGEVVIENTTKDTDRIFYFFRVAGVEFLEEEEWSSEIESGFGTVDKGVDESLPVVFRD